jgi:hypothetical protein
MFSGLRRGFLLNDKPPHKKPHVQPDAEIQKASKARIVGEGPVPFISWKEYDEWWRRQQSRNIESNNSGQDVVGGLVPARGHAIGGPMAPFFPMHAMWP